MFAMFGLGAAELIILGVVAAVLLGALLVVPIVVLTMMRGSRSAESTREVAQLRAEIDRLNAEIERLKKQGA